MHALFLAFRYLWTRPLSWVSVLGIWLSVTATITTVSLMSGYLEETRRTMLATTGHVVLTPRMRRIGEYTAPPPSYQAVEALLSDTPGLAAMAPHLLRPAFAQIEGGAPTLDDDNLLIVTGLDPAREGRVTRILEFARDVSAPELRIDDPDRPFAPPRDAPENARDLPAVLLGAGLFQTLGVKKGDVLVFVTLPEGPVSEQDLIEPRTMRGVVAGAVKTGHFAMDAKSAYMDLATMNEFARSSSDASEICVRAAPGVSAARLAAALRERIGDRFAIGVETWEERNMDILGPVRNQRTILAVILLFFVMVACFNVFATLTILVTDKVRDIGLLTALGSTALGVVKVFTTCGLLLSGIGAVLGGFCGVLMSHRMNWLNDTIDELVGVRLFRASVYTFDRIPIAVDLRFVAAVVAATIGFAILCAFLPALRAGRMDPVQALRYE